VFGTNPLKGNGPDTENEKKLSKELRKAWTDFAKDPAHGLQNLGWPQYDKSSKWTIPRETHNLTQNRTIGHCHGRQRFC
jgi:hypothetical protein